MKMPIVITQMGIDRLIPPNTNEEDECYLNSTDVIKKTTY